MAPLDKLAPTLALALSFAAPPATGAPVRIPGTTVVMDAPQGFEVSRDPRGLFNRATRSQITIAEFPPDAYDEIADAFSSPKTAASRFGARGARITRVEQLNLAAGSAPIAVGDQRIGERNVTKYIALLGGIKTNNMTVLVTFDISERDPFGRGDVEAALGSVKLGHVDTLEEKVARLPFVFEEVPPFRAVNVIARHTAMLASFEGSDRSGAKPTIVIARASTSATPAETPQLAEQVMRSVSGFEDAQITEQGAVTFAGGPGHYMSAVAGERTLVQYMRIFPSGGFIRLVARGDTAALGDVSAAVKEIADSVETR
jgi:hypothetical protein